MLLVKVDNFSANQLTNKPAMKTGFVIGSFPSVENSLSDLWKDGRPNGCRPTLVNRVGAIDGRIERTKMVNINIFIGKKRGNKTDLDPYVNLKS